MILLHKKVVSLSVFGVLLGWLAPGCGQSPEGPEISQPKTVVEVLSASDRVLWLAAHPDDETVAGALIARSRELSRFLYLASLTRGENSDKLWGGLRRGSEIGRARSQLFEQAAEIFQADTAALGPFVNGPLRLSELDALPENAPFQPWPPNTSVQEVISKWSQDWGGSNPVDYLVSLLRRWQPDAVIAMDDYCGVSGHPEHLAVAHLLLEAIPLAAEAGYTLPAGNPWQVRFVIFSAHVIQPLIDCGFCKCRGTAPDEPVDRVFSLDISSTYGTTYYRVSCQVAKHYQNIMEEKEWSRGQILAMCEEAEKQALDAYDRGLKAYPIFEPYRVLEWK